MKKSVTISRSGETLQFTHRLQNRTARSLSFRYGPESQWKLKDAHVNRVGETPALKNFSVVDPAARLEVAWRFSRPARIWHFPREDRTRSERVYLGVSITPLWNVRLAAHGRWSVRWTVTIGEPDARC